MFYLIPILLLMLSPFTPAPEVKGEVIGTATNEYATFGLTDKGEIFWSRDGESWTVIDFNETYRGY